MNHLAFRSSPVTPAPEPERYTARALWKLVRPRLWLILICAIAGALIALAVSMTLPKLYTASGAIAVSSQSFTIPEMQGALRANDSEPMLLVRTEEQAVSSRQLIEKVAGQLHLADRKEFNPALSPPGPVAQVSAFVARLLPSAGPPPQAISTDQAVVLAASKALTVFNDNRSLVITLGFTSRDPALSANFINTLIADYRAARASERGAADQNANAALTEQVSQIGNQIARLEQNVSELRDQGRLVTLRAGGVGQQELESLATQAVQARMQRGQLEATLHRVSALQGAGSTSDYAGSLASETITRLRDQEASAARRVSDLAAHFGPDYPGLRDAQANLASVRQLLKDEDARIISSLGSQLKVARQQEAEAQSQLDAARDQAVKSQGLQTRVDGLERQIADRRALVQQLQQRSQLTVAPVSSQTSDVRELDRAEPPASPSSPKKGPAGLVGGLAGGLIGLLLVLQRSPLARTDTQQSVAAGLPVFATLPARSVKSNGQLLALVAGQKSGQEAESLRMLRTRIRMTAHSAALRVVAFIPAHGGQGGPQVAAAFASIAAADGERVLLIETDLQTPRLAALFDVRRCELPAVLSGDILWRDALVRDARHGVDMLVAGAGSTDAHAMLSGMRLQNLLSEASEEYTLIVLNGPPAGDTANTLAIMHRADAGVLILDRRSADQAAIGLFAADLTRVSSGPVSVLMILSR